MTNTATITALQVVVADDDENIRRSLRMLFEHDGRLRVVAEAHDGRALLEVLPTTRCDAILLDLAMPGKSGLAALEELGRQPGHPPVVALSTYDDAGHVDRALALGASGYVLKSARIAEIVTAVECAVGGGAYLQPAVARAVLDRHLLIGRARPASHPKLSARQVQVLEALCEGLSAKEVADRLRLADGTVGVYIKQLYERLGVTSRGGAVAVAIRSGLVR